jgi:hypothetical protein
MDWRSRLILAIATILLPCASLEASAGLEIIKHDVPAVLESGSVATVPIIVANGGSLPWSPAGGFALSYHWLDAARETVVWDGRRTPLPETVIPGASIALVATVEAPVGAGNYWLLWDVVQEGVLWVSETGAEEPEPIPVSVSPGHSFRMSEGSAPRIMTAGSESVVELVLHNDGDRTWRADGTFAVAYHWLGRDGGGVRAQGQSVYWEGRRTPFPVAVRGGEGSRIVRPNRCPHCGYWLRPIPWRVGSGGHCWFLWRVLPRCRSGGVVDREFSSLFFQSETSCGVWARCRSNRVSF